MTEQEFHSNAKAADTFRRLAQCPEDDFWVGYRRGLSRHYHGEKFGTEDEHLLWLASVNSTDEGRQMRGRGYRSGFEGQNVKQAMQAMLTLAGPQTYECTRCGHAWKPRGDRAPHHCPKCKSPYWDRPRRR